MRVKPGCGCVLLVLALINALIAVTMIWSLATSPESIGLSVLMLMVFIANVAVCAMVGLAALRNRPGIMPRSGDEHTLDSPEGSEGEDE
jgi:uncharacterized membrane protein